MRKDYDFDDEDRFLFEDEEPDLYKDNLITMTLEEFLGFRDALEFKQSLEEYAKKSVCPYDEGKRDLVDIGEHVLKLFGLSSKIERLFD